MPKKKSRKLRSQKTKSISRKVWLILGAAAAVIIILILLSMFFPSLKQVLFGKAISKGSLMHQDVWLNYEKGVMFSGERGDNYILFYEGQKYDWSNGYITVCQCSPSCPAFAACQELLKYNGLKTTTKLNNYLFANDKACFYITLYSIRGTVNIYECLGEPLTFETMVSTPESIVEQEIINPNIEPSTPITPYPSR